MKVEHITLGGNSVIRNTADILQSTKRVLDSIQLSYESRFVIIPKLPFKLKITATDEGAAFDIMKGDDLAITNFCCFESKFSNSVLANIEKLAEMYSKMGWHMKVIEPVTPCWIYSAIINPTILDKESMMIAGEVELYIFEQLYIAYENQYEKNKS